MFLFCEVCKNKLTIDAINESDIKLTEKLRGISKYTILRCRNCHTCQSCGIPKTHKAFEGKDAHCKNCEKLHCEVCDKDLPRHAFSTSQVRNKVLGQNPFLRCSGCHTCTGCSEEKIIRMFHNNERHCIMCSKQTLHETCDGCQTQKPIQSFDELILQNARKYERRRVCLSCQEKGLSPMDIQTYPCYGCGQKGHNKFMPNTLYRYKKGSHCTTMVCLDCTERRVNIQKALDELDSLRCTCPGKKDRRHLPTNENVTSTQVATWERNNGQEKTKGLLRMTYVSWTSWRSADECNALVRCFPGDDLPKNLSLSSFPPSNTF